MADINEKTAGDITEHVSNPDSMHKAEITHTKVVIGDDAYNQAYAKEPPHAFNAVAMQLYLCAVIGFFCSTANGFDSSML